jgi:hypothetical protein
VKWLTAVTAIVAAVVLTPSVVHADAAGPTDYLSEITGVTPESVLDVVDLDIVGGDAFVRVRVEPGHEVVIRGYLPDEEPYLRITADGTIEQNRKSYATYYNADRFGATDIPDVVDTEAPPDWERIGNGHEYSWHDHRAHWMSEQPLIGLDPGESLPAQEVPIVVDGVEASITVVTTLQPSPSPLPAIAGALLGVAIGLAGLVLGRATATLAAVVLSSMALVAGLSEYLSLPSSTGPSYTWWALPAIALVCSLAVIALYRRSVWVEVGLLAIAGVQLFLWGWQRRDNATSAFIPTNLPMAADRVISMAVVTGSVFIVAAAGRALWPVLRPPVHEPA